MSKRIFARYKVPSQKELENGLKERAKFFNLTVEKYLDRYIKSRIGDIAESTEIIVREKQRIQKAKKAINVALFVMNKGGSGEIKDIAKKYYNDLLRFQISSISTRVKDYE